MPSSRDEILNRRRNQHREIIDQRRNLNDTKMTKVLETDPLRYLEKLEAFDGKYADLPAFIANIEDIIPTLKKYDAPGQTMLINTIKRKIIGKARMILEIQGNLQNWEEIKAISTLNFSSMKTKEELYEDLRSTTFKTNAIEFFNELRERLFKLNQKVIQRGTQLEVNQNIILTLKIFKQNMIEPMRSILFSRNPRTLEEALIYLRKEDICIPEFKILITKIKFQINFLKRTIVRISIRIVKIINLIKTKFLIQIIPETILIQIITIQILIPIIIKITFYQIIIVRIII